jgi:hypothetical protein
MSRFAEFDLAVKEAGVTMRAADQVAGQMAQLLRGRLRQCSGYALADLKRELRDFNIQTRAWME